MCPQAVARWPPALTTPAAARQFVGELCADWCDDDVSDDLTLIVSELVTNTLLHARSDVTVSLEIDSESAYLVVEDDDPRPPRILPDRVDLLADLDSLEPLADRHRAEDEDARHPSLHVGDPGAVTAGRGLLLVDALADEWGVDSAGAAGKKVWVRRRLNRQGQRS